MIRFLPSLSPSGDMQHSRATPWVLQVWRRFRRGRLPMAGLIYILLISVAAAGAQKLAPYDYAEQNVVNRLMPPSATHWLGTDEYGRDVLSRILVGAHVSLTVGVVSVVLLLAVGTALGLLAGYHRSLDGPLMRLVDLMMSIPNFFLLLTVVALFGATLKNTVMVIGLTSWMPTARLVRGEVLSLRERDFTQAALALGARDSGIMVRHLLPNALSVILVQATLSLSMAILLESSLSYLGLGAQPPTPTWGNMLATGRNYMRSAWWVTTFPGMAIFLTVMAFNFVGDGLRDSLDPRMK